MAEFPRPVRLALVGPTGRSVAVEAEAAECAALARRFGILGVGRVAATLRLTPEADGAVLARGTLEATVTQACVVSLDPVEQQVREPVALRLLPPGRAAADGPEDLDEIETGMDGVVDLGEALAEQLSLALDPYPRAPGASLPAAATEAPRGPFAALAALRRQEG